MLIRVHWGWRVCSEGCFGPQQKLRLCCAVLHPWMPHVPLTSANIPSLSKETPARLPSSRPLWSAGLSLFKLSFGMKLLESGWTSTS